MDHTLGKNEEEGTVIPIRRNALKEAAIVTMLPVLIELWSPDMSPPTTSDRLGVPIIGRLYVGVELQQTYIYLPGKGEQASLS